MNSLRHAFWRGAMALSLLTLGVGSGFGFREVPVAALDGPACDGRASGAAAMEAVDFEPVEVDALREVALQLRAQGNARRG